MTHVRPEAGMVARRLLILKRLIVHAIAAPPREMMVEMIDRWSQTEQEKFREEEKKRSEEMLDNLKSCGLWDELSPSEKQFASRTMADMTHREQVDFSWRMEAAVVLMWGLGFLQDLPPIHEIADHELLKQFPKTGVGEFTRDAQLRDQQVIDEARDTIELWNWRSRTRWLIEDGQSPELEEGPAAELGFRTFDDIARHTAKLAHKDGRIGEILDEDFVAFGKPYRDLDADEWATIRSITQERHFALNWVCGYAPGNEWDETTTDT